MSGDLNCTHRLQTAFWPHKCACGISKDRVLQRNRIKKNTYCFPDDFLIVSKRSEDQKQHDQKTKIKNKRSEEEKFATNSFHIKLALRSIVHKLQFCKQKTTKIPPFEAHFGRKSNTPFKLSCTTPKLSNISY